MARRRPSRLTRNEWDPKTARYADLSHPEWLDRVPGKFWDDPHNHKRYMTWLAGKLGVKKPADWYQFRAIDFEQNHGAGFLKHYDAPGTYINAIKAHRPRFQWHEWLFHQVPVGFWKVRENRLRYRDWLAKRIGFRNVTDWYGLNQAILKANNGCGFMDHYNGAIQKIVNDFYPDQDWKPWFFKPTYMGFWKKKENRNSYLLWLADELGIKDPDDWYKVTLKDFVRNHGGALMQYNGNGGFETLLDDLYPDRKWQRWRFRQTAKGFWKSKSNRVEYLKWLGERCGFESFEDWLKLQSRHLMSNGGYQVFVEYMDTDVTRAVKELFPGRECHPWMFPKVPQRHWSAESNRREYVRWLGRQLGLRTNEDWYALERSHFQANYGGNLVNKYGPICELVCNAFPKRKFHPWLFVRTPREFWKSPKNRAAYFDWLGKQLGIKTVSDWDKIRVSDIVDNGGGRLFSTVYDNKKANIIAAIKRSQRRRQCAG